LSLIYQPKKWVGESNSSEKPQTPPTDNVEKLLKLNELKEKGIITQEEFDKQKKNLLSSM
ncbi:MAG: SHOCT domain-containing protein, partial [Alphaproteobacteria bacterium]|nr:SHOCT domain-containing protein [Alphaproteobacteria bacterium]